MSVTTDFPDTELPRWAAMWLIAAGMFAAGKLATWRRAGLGAARHHAAGYFLLWPGMDAGAFVGVQPSGCQKQKTISLKAGLQHMILGILLLWIVARQFTYPLAAGWCGMVGLIFVLHFGLFGLLASLWRRVGVAVTPIMDCPIAATSVAEFWGRRWNVAFRELAHVFVFRPVARHLGLKAALWTSFAVSGLVHELVISVPAGAGYGLPTAYFLLQAAGITLERRVFRGALTAERRTSRWLFSHALTALPAFFLFHPPFVERVMIPFFHVIGALP